MKKDSTPWAYRSGKGLLYSIPAGYKLILLLGLSMAVFFLDFYWFLVMALIVVFFSVNAGIRPWQLLRGSGSIAVLCLGIILFKALDFFPLRLDPGGLKESILLGLRMGLSFSTGALLFKTTTMGEIQKSLSRLEVFLHLKKFRLSLLISLMLSFLPRFFEIWENTDFAWKSRAGKNGFIKLMVLIPLVIDRMMEKAAQIAEALESKGF